MSLNQPPEDDIRIMHLQSAIVQEIYAWLSAMLCLQPAGTIYLPSQPFSHNAILVKWFHDAA
jgi:hypothetical protein